MFDKPTTPLECLKFWIVEVPVHLRGNLSYYIETAVGQDIDYEEVPEQEHFLDVIIARISEEHGFAQAIMLNSLAAAVDMFMARRGDATWWEDVKQGILLELASPELDPEMRKTLDMMLLQHAFDRDHCLAAAKTWAEHRAGMLSTAHLSELMLTYVD